MNDTALVIAGKTYTSRLILGTGKYKTFDLMKQALMAADPAMVTIAIRRVDLSDKSTQSFWSFLPAGLPILPNTAGCYTAEEAIRTAHIARELLQTDLIKLEVIGDPKTLFPDVQATLEATRVLVKEGFTVLPYTSDDPIMARRLEEAGACHHYAARGSDRQWAGYSQSSSCTIYSGSGQSPCHCGCRGRNGFRCGCSDGIGRRRCSHEHSGRRSSGSRGHG